MEGRYFRLLYHDGTEFFLDQEGTHIWCIWPSHFTLEDACVYLVGPVLGFVLRLRGLLCLHASAVAIGDQAIALLGPGGAGKSTTAAAFADLGYPVISDDIAALREENEKFCVLPGYPRLCLWPESVTSLPAARRDLPAITPNWEKRFLDLTAGGYRFQGKALRLAAIYLLSNRLKNAAAPSLETVSPQESMVQLVGNSYTNYLLDSAMRAREFETLSRLLQRVNLRRVIPADDPRLVPQLCETILNDFQGLALAR